MTTRRKRLEEERAYSQAMRDTLLRLGHHPAAKHQSPQQYDGESGDACTIPACLAALGLNRDSERKALRALVDVGCRLARITPEGDRIEPLPYLWHALDEALEQAEAILDRSAENKT